MSSFPDLSNDEVDEENQLTEQRSRFRSRKLQEGIRKQRSLTPEKPALENHGCLPKQRSLTPENRILTPEERKKIHSKYQQSSSSRNNTLERQQKRFEDKKPVISRSSSSSSYSGGEHETSRRSIQNRLAQKASGESKIRRSR